MKSPNEKSEEEWKQELSDKQYFVLRMKGTEKPFTGEFWDHEEEGIYKCAGCRTPLFKSNTKFKSGCGWPSFYSPLNEENVEERRDTSHGMIRTEIVCKECGGHLGHVFNDGPEPTGLRYCINSASLTFEKEE